MIFQFENGNEKAFLELSVAFLCSTFKREFIAHSILIVLYLWSISVLNLIELGKRSKVTFMVKISFSNHEYVFWPVQLVTLRTFPVYERRLDELHH